MTSETTPPKFCVHTNLENKAEFVAMPDAPKGVPSFGVKLRVRCTQCGVAFKFRPERHGKHAGIYLNDEDRELRVFMEPEKKVTP